MQIRQTILLGGAQTDFSKNYSEIPNSFQTLFQEVFESGLKDADLTRANITSLKNENKVGAFVGNFAGQKFTNQGHLNGILTEADSIFTGMPSGRYEAACASGSLALLSANYQILAGDIDLAFVFGVELMKNVSPLEANDYLGGAAIYDKEASGIRFAFPTLFGKIAEEIISRSEISEDRMMKCFTRISEINRENAKKNPNAQTRDQTIDLDILNKKYQKSFGGKTRYSDCSQITDGASLVILARPNLAEKLRKPKNKLAVLAGWGHTTSIMNLESKLQKSEDIPNLMPETTKAIKIAYNRAGVEVDNLDVFETHDCFTCSEYIALSAFGISPVGKEYEAIEDDRISIKGKTPVNPSGGLIGTGHPVGASGVRMALDLYKQVTNQAGNYQVDNAKKGAFLNIGGNFTTNIAAVITSVENS